MKDKTENKKDIYKRYFLSTEQWDHAGIARLTLIMLNDKHLETDGIYSGRKTTNEPEKPNSPQGDHMQPKAGDRNGGVPGNNSSEKTGNSCATCNNDKSNQSLWH